MITIRQFARKKCLSESGMRHAVRVGSAKSLKIKKGVSYFSEPELVKLARNAGLMLDSERFLFLFKSNTMIETLNLCGAKRSALDWQLKNDQGFADKYAEIKASKGGSKRVPAEKLPPLPEFPKGTQRVVDGLACKIGVHGKVFCWINGAWVLSSKTKTDFKNGMSIRTVLATGEVK